MDRPAQLVVRATSRLRTVRRRLRVRVRYGHRKAIRREYTHQLVERALLVGYALERVEADDDLEPAGFPGQPSELTRHEVRVRNSLARAGELVANERKPVCARRSGGHKDSGSAANAAACVEHWPPRDQRGHEGIPRRALGVVELLCAGAGIQPGSCALPRHGATSSV